MTKGVQKLSALLVAQSVLVVAGDAVYRRDIHRPASQLQGRGGVKAMGVGHIPGQGDEVGLLRLNALNQILLILSEGFAVQVGNLNDFKAVQRPGQIFGLYGMGRDDKRIVFIMKPGGQRQKDQQQAEHLSKNGTFFHWRLLSQKG